MLNVRQSVFETNSSSTHSICISKKEIDTNKLKGKSLHFELGEYGWEWGNADPANYLYTAIRCLDKGDLLDKIKSLLDRLGVQYTFEREEEDPHKRSWFDGYYIDHVEDLEPLLEALANDEDLLIRYLFGDTDVFTGNDNDDGDAQTTDVAQKWVWDNEKHKTVPNPYHDPTKYDYYYKGN